MRRNIPIYRSLKFKITLLGSLVFLLTIFFMINKSNDNQQELIRLKEEDLSQIAVETIDRRFKVSYEILETSLTQVTTNPVIIEAISLGDRDKLFELVSPAYEKLKEVGVDEFHFYFPDNSSILNLYGEEDNELITDCDRTIVKDINQDPEHQAIKGLEECRRGLHLRYVAPMYKDNEYIGSVELGMNVESRILNIFRNVSGGEWYLYSLKDNEHSLLESTILEDKYPMVMSEAMESNMANGQVYKFEDSSYIIQLVPVANYKGEYKNYFKQVYDKSELITLQNEYTEKYVIYGASAAFFGLFLLWTVMSYLLDPLKELEENVRKFELGMLTEPIQVKTKDEIGYLAKAMENMRQSIHRREEDLKRQSYIDPLTGVYNRLSFDKNLKEIADQGLLPTTLIMADIDGLKLINDNKGHARGDAYIIECTKVMKRALRDSDRLFRIGGDEFILLFANTDEETGKLILNRVKNEIDIHNQDLRKDGLTISLSFGIGICEQESDCLDLALAKADKRMYEEKEKKKSKNMKKE